MTNFFVDRKKYIFNQPKFRRRFKPGNRRYSVEGEGSSFAMHLRQGYGAQEATADKPSPTQNITLKPGDIVQSETGSKPDFWESNWYKVLTSLAVVTGIVKTLGN